MPEGVTRSLLKFMPNVKPDVEYATYSGWAIASQGTLHVLNKTWLGDKLYHKVNCRGGLLLLGTATPAGGQLKHLDTQS